MAFTVVPLHNLHLPRGTSIPFGNDFVLQDMPQWVKDDKGILGDINYYDRQAILEDKHALVAEYEANSIGQPIPHGQSNLGDPFKILRMKPPFSRIWLCG